MNQAKKERSSRSIGRIIICNLLIFTCFAIVGHGQAAAPEPLDFPFEITHPLEDSLKRPCKQLYVFLAEEHFTRKNLSALFRTLSGVASDLSLDITVFSDREYLERRKKLDKVGLGERDEYTPTQQKAIGELFPPRTGFFRAFYMRNPWREQFHYSPGKDVDRLIKVTIKEKPGRGDNNEQILIEAINSGFVSDVDRVLSQVSTLDFADANGSSPLSSAVWLHHNDIALKLIAAGADVNFKTVTGTALFAAIDARNYEGVKLLLESNAFVNQTTDIGKTPLMASVLYCDHAITRLLVDSGANPQAKDVRGKLAIDYACKDERILTLLKAKLPVEESKMSFDQKIRGSLKQ